MWLIFRLFLEICGGATGIAATIAKCHTLADLCNVFMGLDELQRAGFLVLTLMVVGGLVEVLRYLTQMFKPSSPPSSPAPRRRRRRVKKPAHQAAPRPSAPVEDRPSGSGS